MLASGGFNRRTSRYLHVRGSKNDKLLYSLPIARRELSAGGAQQHMVRSGVGGDLNRRFTLSAQLRICYLCVLRRPSHQSECGCSVRNQSTYRRESAAEQRNHVQTCTHILAIETLNQIICAAISATKYNMLRAYATRLYAFAQFSVANY